MCLIIGSCGICSKLSDPDQGDSAGLPVPGTCGRALPGGRFDRTTQGVAGEEEIATRVAKFDLGLRVYGLTRLPKA